MVRNMFPGDAFNQWFWTHFFQEDYYQFYIIVVLGLIYFEWRYRAQKRFIMEVTVKETLDVLQKIKESISKT
jgi:hypothetical protein